MTVNNSVNINNESNSVVVGTGTGFSNIGYSEIPDSSNFCQIDSNQNLSSNLFISSYTTTVSTGGTTTLTVSSSQKQYFTGGAQTVALPVASTLVLGQTFTIVNIGPAAIFSGLLTINSSGGNKITSINAGFSTVFTCISTTGTTAASWSTSGPFVSESILSGASPPSSGTPYNLTSLLLTPGSYLLRGLIATSPATSVTSVSLAINTTSASVSGTLSMDFVTNSGITTTGTVNISIPSLPVIVSTTTTWYINGEFTYIGAKPSTSVGFIAQRIA